MRRAAVAGALALALALPATAAAQSPPPAAVTAAPTGVLQVGHARAVLLGHSFIVRGTVKPYVTGHHVVVRVWRNGHKLRDYAAPIVPVAGGAAGAFAVRVRSGRPGRLRISVVHPGSAALGAGRAPGFDVWVLRPSVHPGSRGLAVHLLQSRLAALRYAVSRSGVYDAATQRAVLAWRKVRHMARTSVANAAVFRGLVAGHGQFHVRHPRDGHHVEARLDLQVLALIDRGKVVRIYNTSSGKASTPTVRGRFRVYLKTPGVNSEGMVDSSYFIRGYAIHGYISVPNFPASHGCLRVPLPDARPIYDWVRMGDVVWVEA